MFYLWNYKKTILVPRNPKREIPLEVEPTEPMTIEGKSEKYPFEDDDDDEDDLEKEKKS